MIDEKELIKEGIKYLSNNIRFRDMPDIKDRFSIEAPAIKYANNQNRIIRRVLDFIEKSEENLQWLHDYLLKADLHNDIFKLFFKF